MQVDVRYDPASLSLISVRRQGPARHALLAVNATMPGIVRLALASGVPLAPADGTPLELIFASSERHASVPAAIVRATVDETAAQ